MGERFLEKIVQINFRIPLLDDATLNSYASTLLAGGRRDGSEEHSSHSTRVPNADAARAEEQLEAQERTGKSTDQAAVELIQKGSADVPAEVIQQVAEKRKIRRFEEDIVVNQAVSTVLLYLGRNPRKIKRFINNFRLQVLIAQRRGLLDTGQIELGLLAKALLITTRYPDFIAAIEQNPDFISELFDAVQARDNYRDLQRFDQNPQASDQAIFAERTFNMYLSDSWVKRYIDSADLQRILKSLGEIPLDHFISHLRIAGTAATSSSMAAANKE